MMNLVDAESGKNVSALDGMYATAKMFVHYRAKMHRHHDREFQMAAYLKKVRTKVLQAEKKKDGFCKGRR